MKTVNVKKFIDALIHELQAAWNESGNYYAPESKVLDLMISEYQKGRFPSEQISRFAKLGIHIEVVADTFALYPPPESQVAYRGIVHWFENQQWHDEDLGLDTDWEVAFDKCTAFAGYLEKNHCKILKDG